MSGVVEALRSEEIRFAIGEADSEVLLKLESLNRHGYWEKEHPLISISPSIEMDERIKDRLRWLEDHKLVARSTEFPEDRWSLSEWGEMLAKAIPQLPKLFTATIHSDTKVITVPIPAFVSNPKDSIQIRIDGQLPSFSSKERIMMIFRK